MQAEQQHSRIIKEEAAALGFDRCGIAAAAPIRHKDALTAWLAEGMAGTMGYLHRHLETRIDLRAWLPSAKSVIVVALNYHQSRPRPPDQRPRGRVAMYAWGEDYHVVVRRKLEALVERLRGRIEQPFEATICVDTSAIVERELAAMAGVGWIGKNTLVLHQSLGSYFFLGEIATDLPVAPDPPEPDHCGNCTRCLDACPTQAFFQPYAMDARRCISYLTIEHRGEIESDLAAGMGEWVFGCDVCQEACPYNQGAPPTREEAFAPTSPEAIYPALDDIAAWDSAAYASFTRGKATNRAKLDMWKRNVAASSGTARRTVHLDQTALPPT